MPVELRRWLEQVAALLRRGQVALVDYADVAERLVARGPASWLRTYRVHGHGTDPFDSPGEQDITADVPVEYLLTVAERVGLRPADPVTQADWLRSLGVDDLAGEGAATWRARAHLGDLEAIAGRSRVHEAAALTDPTGLGAHRVFVLHRP